MPKTLSARACTTLLAPLVLLVAGQGCCSCGQKALGSIDGALNDPSNRTLRRNILSYGLKEFCTEMTTHSAPLALTPESPVIGRFYPESCAQKEGEHGDLIVEFAGRGYAYTNLSKKMTFFMSGAVQYNQDFQMDGSTMYAYFRTRNLLSTNFRILQIEQPVASALNALSPVGNTVGQQLVNDKMRGGFTVIVEPCGSADFAFGMIAKGTSPKHPFDVHGTDRITYENSRTEVHQGQRDLIGPIKVSGSGRAIYVQAQVDGVSAIDVLVLDAQTGRASTDLYLNYPQSGALAGQPIFSEAASSGTPYSRSVKVPEGLYYVVLDNTPTAGTVQPPMNPFDDRAAVVNYVVQVGDEP